MNKLATFLIIILGFACNNQEKQAAQPISKVNNPGHQIAEPPYDIKLEIDKDENGLYNLIVAIELRGNSNFVSPFSKGDYKGRFNISIKDNDNIILNDELLETPESVETIDLMNGGLVSLVNESTTYKQGITVLGQGSFEVSGMVQFVIEPRCTFERIGFVIKYSDGDMKVELIDC